MLEAVHARGIGRGELELRDPADAPVKLARNAAWRVLPASFGPILSIEWSFATRHAYKRGMSIVRCAGERAHDRLAEAVLADLYASRVHVNNSAPLGSTVPDGWGEPTEIDPDVTAVFGRAEAADSTSYYWSVELKPSAEPAASASTAPAPASAASGAHWFVAEDAPVAVDTTTVRTFRPLRGAVALVAFGVAVASLVTWLL